jgi:hypothetical protein
MSSCLHSCDNLWPHLGSIPELFTMGGGFFIYLFHQLKASKVHEIIGRKVVIASVLAYLPLRYIIGQTASIFEMPGIVKILILNNGPQKPQE